jgi:hypothetical protein
MLHNERDTRDTDAFSRYIIAHLSQRQHSDRRGGWRGGGEKEEKEEKEEEEEEKTNRARKENGKESRDALVGE